MRTKHLFYTAAMAALFAACVNDDFETISKGQNAANDGRPVVTDVKLKFTTGADTRLAFGGNGYAWETNDTIGALLMDNVLSVDEDKSWLQRYQLVSNIHTSYPFTYSTTEETWGCNTKMLEGNYFFAYPWESYEGQREVRHSLLKQSQNGISGDVVAESYADNQFFIGYSQIKAGTDAKDALNDVEMVPLLGAIQLRIVNTGTQSYHLNKIVLSGNDDIASVMTFNPRNAAYGTDNDKDKWNLQGAGYQNWFNYANYTGNEADVYDVDATTLEPVYNIEDGDEYKRIEALRAVAQKHDGLSKEKSAQLTILGTEEERELLPGQKNTAYVLIMCNPIKVKEGNNNGEGLKLSIYADEGFVQNIDLSKVNGDSEDNTVVTSAKVSEVGPSVTNTIKVQLEDNSFTTPEEMTVYNAADLLQFIQWNAAIDGNRDAVAVLAENVTFTKEMLDALKANKGTSLTIQNTKEGVSGQEGEEVLTLAEDIPANVLDDEQLTIKTDIVVKGALELTENSEKGKTVGNITVEKDATLTINDAKANVPSEIENNGTLNIGANAALKDGLSIDNFGTIVLAKGGDSKANVTNNADAVINNNGYMQNVTNKKDGLVNLGENSTLSLKNNEGKVVTAKGATVNGTNAGTGEIQYVEGAVINPKDGIISTEFTGATLTEETLKGTKVNKIILTKSTTVTADMSFDYMEIAEGGELIVNEGKTLVVKEKLTVSGNATISGKGTVSSAKEMEIEEDAELTVANTAKVIATGTFTNNGMVYNNGTFNTPNATEGNGGWKYNTPGNSNEAATLTTMKAAVKYWIINAVPNVENSKYYAYNPTDIKAFIASMDVWVADVNGVKEAEELATAWDVESFASMATNANFVATFNSAVNSEILNEANIKAATAKVISQGKFISTMVPTQDATLYENEAKANAALKVAVVAELTGTAGTENRIVAAAAYGITGLETALAATTDPITAQYTYIWNGCKLDEVMEVVRLISVTEWKNALGTSWTNTEQTTPEKIDLKVWMKAVLDASNTSGNNYVTKAKEVVGKYIMEYQNWQYSQAQIAAAGK